MAKKERRPAKDKPKNATSDSPPKPPQEKDYVFPPIGSAVVPQSGQAAADLGRLEKQKCLSWTNCLELMFGKSEEPQEHLNRLAPWKHKHYGNFLTPSKRPPSDDTRIKFVEIKKELLHQEPVSFPGGQARLLFLPGGVYEAPADFADGMLLEHGYGIETTRPLSTESELAELLQSVLGAVDGQRELRGKFFEAVKREEIATSEKTDLAGAIDHWNMDRQSFCLWAKGSWDEISPMRHFPEDRPDVLQGMVERIKDAKSLDSPSAVKSPKSAKSKRHDPYGDLKKKIATLVKKHKDHSPSEIRKMITPHVLQECHLQDNPPAEKTLMGWIREVRKAEGLSSRPGRPKKK